MWSRIKGYAIAAGVGIAGLLAVIASVYNAGKKSMLSDSLQAGQKEEGAHRANLDKADAARNDHIRTGGVPISQDPNNRANRRNGQV